jgi:hypothetical protein
MTRARLVVAGMLSLAAAGCAERREVVGPEGAALAVSAARQVDASGEFAALVDFSTLSLTPRGQNCLLVVAGRLVFSGTIEGTATGVTTALVSAPCEDVATTPPGTFSDVFHSRLSFEGTVDGEPAQADVIYAGRVQPGGAIAGRLLFSGDVRGELSADARVAVGGDYSGSVVVQ